MALMLRDYRPGPPIGRGGMADVMLAVQTGRDGFARLVVQKRMLHELRAREDLVRAFIAEARLLSRLSHPNVVQVLDVGEDESGPFVVVEYLSGETLLTVLRDMARRRQVLPWPMVCRLGADLAAGLAAAHGATSADGSPRPILHRDLSPSNVVVCWNGAVKLIDFGIAKALGTGDTMTGTIKGKLSYLAPELLRGERVDERADLFQLGVVLYEALSGRRLFDAPDDAMRIQAVLERPVPRLRAAMPEVPDELEMLIERLLARDPQARPCGASGVRRAIERVMRRYGGEVSTHELGDWMRTEMAGRMAERVAREVDCLTGLTIVDEPRTIELDREMPEIEVVVAPDQERRRGGRWRQICALMLLSGAIGAATAAVRIDAPVQASITREPAEPAETVMPVPEPIVRPLPALAPAPAPAPAHEHEHEHEHEPAPEHAHAREHGRPKTDNVDPWRKP
jgi:serine/threonine-protein kinase